MRGLSILIAMILVLSQSIGCTGRTANDARAPAEPANTTDASSQPVPSSEVSPEEQTAEVQATPDAETLPTPEDSAIAQQYQALLAEYEAEGGARIFAKRFLQLPNKIRMMPG